MSLDIGEEKSDWLPVPENGSVGGGMCPVPVPDQTLAEASDSSQAPYSISLTPSIAHLGRFWQQQKVHQQQSLEGKPLEVRLNFLLLLTN